VLRYLVPNISRAYALDISECGRPPNYFSTSALEWFCLYHAGLNGADGKVPCTSFAECKTFGGCKPTEFPFAETSEDPHHAAARVVSRHVQSQSLPAATPTPVLQFARELQQHVADDDAALPALISKVA
jgi:hypothetical protein